MMARFNLDDYTPVEERIALFYGDHPGGRILTRLEKLEPPLVVFKATVFRADDLDPDFPWASGYAYEKEGEGHVNRTSYIENCETSAIGRALANAGYHGKRDGSPRPSREEMEKVKRMEDGPPMGVQLESLKNRALNAGLIDEKGAAAVDARIKENDYGKMVEARDKLAVLIQKAKTNTPQEDAA